MASFWLITDITRFIISCKRRSLRPSSAISSGVADRMRIETIIIGRERSSKRAESDMKEQRGANDETLVNVFVAAGLSAEMEAQSIHALLEANGIDSVVVRQNVPELPVGKVEVRVVASDAERATEVIREGQAAGPSAAE